MAVIDRSLPERPVLQLIWEGMPVIDVDGALIGAVKYVREGDPSASVPDKDKPFAEEDLNEAFARALMSAEPQVDPQLAGRLIQRGFLKVAGAGLMDHDRYVAADQIAGANEDEVRLAARADQLVVERERWI
ncbi:hypothetical protein [Kribbella sp. CA-293567]|uniref:hypothetical protein n=1 Tax=Kribbella sp. CA-293567 TaxID=3002436 RepID=UPI0022DE7080|nr:hypothetical protein [Kribbella sp. CA-293567]WBQ03388.1 hypothetical protein OX958_25855 [Kribbella sp. CA-293567]